MASSSIASLDTTWSSLAASISTGTRMRGANFSLPTRSIAFERGLQPADGRRLDGELGRGLEHREIAHEALAVRGERLPSNG